MAHEWSYTKSSINHRPRLVFDTGHSITPLMGHLGCLATHWSVPVGVRPKHQVVRPIRMLVSSAQGCCCDLPSCFLVCTVECLYSFSIPFCITEFYPYPKWCTSKELLSLVQSGAILDNSQNSWDLRCVVSPKAGKRNCKVSAFLLIIENFWKITKVSWLSWIGLQPGVHEKFQYFYAPYDVVIFQFFMLGPISFFITLYVDIMFCDVCMWVL